MKMAESDQIMQAAKALARGELVAFPTETVYGLGADASSAEAVARIFQAKGRPNDHPVIVHVADADAALCWARNVPEAARALMTAFWPGPLTLILERADWVDPGVSGGQSTIGLRCPSHPVAVELLEDFTRLREGRPAGIAAPSANRFGHVSPTRAEHVKQEFSQLIKQGMLVLDGGDADVGIESTIVDLSRLSSGKSPALLRPGAILPSDIEAVLGMPLAGHDSGAPRVSGALKAHYSPRTPMRLLPAQSLAGQATQWLVSHPQKRLVVVTRDPDTSGLGKLEANGRLISHTMPFGPTEYAKTLYAQLRAVDSLQADQLFWEEVPQTEAWSGVRDRLQRAAAAFE